MPEIPYRVPARIETERLVIRRFVDADAEAVAEVVTRNVDHLRRYMEWITFEPQTVEQRREWIADTDAKFEAGEDYTLGMFLHDGTFVGGTGFHVRSNPDRLEIGYWIDAAHEGKGLVTESSAALTLVGLRVAGAHTVSIAHAESNARSGAVPERLGFERQSAPGAECFEDGSKGPGVDWFATADTLAAGPLASFPLPRAYEFDGEPMQWTA